MRNFRTLSLALVAVLVFGAITAAAAPANQFHAASAKTTVTVASNATQSLFLEAGGPSINCTIVSGSGTVTVQTVTEVRFAPTYSKCQGPLTGSSAEVDMNGCQYLFTIEATENRGPAHIRCPTEGGVQKQIEITIGVAGFAFCTYHIGEQTPAGKSDYANNGVNRIIVQPTQSGIVITRQGATECGSAQIPTGSYFGKVEVKGEITGQTTETNIQVG